MPSSSSGLSVADEKRYIGIIFFLFAAQIMSWVPRFPEIKANLSLSNGEFGTYLSLGSIGAIIAMLSTGHFVHKLGAKKVLIISTLAMCLAISVISHLHSAPIFIIVNIINGAAVSGFNTAINAQAFHAQDRAGEMIISRQHGYWTIGAVATAILSGALVEFVPIAWHINILSFILFFVIMYYIQKLDPEMIKPSAEEEDDFGFKDLFTSFRIDYLVSTALVCGIMVEFATSDWSSIYAKETIGVRGSLATVPYIVTFVAMIVGRLGIHKVTPYISLQKMVKIEVSSAEQALSDLSLHHRFWWIIQRVRHISAPSLDLLSEVLARHSYHLLSLPPPISVHLNRARLWSARWVLSMQFWSYV